MFHLVTSSLSLHQHGSVKAQILAVLLSVLLSQNPSRLENLAHTMEEFTEPQVRVFSNESVIHIRWPKYWSFSFDISPSNEHLGLISFRMDWLDLLAVQGTLESSPTPHFKSISSSALSFLYGPTLTSIHDYWKNHSFD